MKKKGYTRNTVTDNIISDRFLNFDYEPFSRNEEMSLLKKIKLSYYDEVNDEKKQQYLNYYFEEVPSFKEKYENADNKEEVLEDEIEKAVECRSYFLANNRRLVYSFVKALNASKYYFVDLFQEGMIGMMTALEKFDIETGNKFSTYARWWIRQAVIRNMRIYSKDVKISENLSEKIYIYDKTKEILEIELGREPSKEEIAEKMGEKDIDRVILAKYRSSVRSLDEPVGDEDSDSLGEFVADNEDKIEEADDRMAFSVLYDVIAELDITERERKILNMLYGLNGLEVHSIQQVADEFCVSGNRIRQLENKLLLKLRLNKKIIDLHEDLMPGGDKVKVLKRGIDFH